MNNKRKLLSMPVLETPKKLKPDCQQVLETSETKRSDIQQRQHQEQLVKPSDVQTSEETDFFIDGSIDAGLHKKSLAENVVQKVAPVLAAPLTSPSASSFNENYFNNMMWLYEKEVAKEIRLISEVSYNLCLKKPLFVSTGLSPARGFIPVIKIICGKKCNISLLHYDWLLFLDKWDIIDEHFAKQKQEKNCKSGTLNEVEVQEIDVLGSNIVIRLMNSKNTVTFISRGSSITLNRLNFEKLKSLRELLEYHLSIFKVLDFPTFYDRVLKEVLYRSGDQRQNIKDLLLHSGHIVEPLYFENVSSFLEILVYEEPKVKRDLGSLYLLANYNKFNEQV